MNNTAFITTLIRTYYCELAIVRESRKPNRAVGSRQSTDEWNARMCAAQ